MHRALFCDPDSGSKKHGPWRIIRRRFRRLAVRHLDRRGFEALHRLSLRGFPHLMPGVIVVERGAGPYFLDRRHDTIRAAPD